MPIFFFTTVAAPPVSGASLALGVRFRVFTNLGVIAPGARLWTYLAGTPSTPLATYADYLETIPNSNPVIADTSGLLPAVYLAPGQAYHLVLANARPLARPVYVRGSLAVPWRLPEDVAAAVEREVAHA